VGDSDRGADDLAGQEPVSRASYIDVAVHCQALRISADEALARIRERRPIADPNPGFLNQLRRLWP
jgi:hypothetical protein